MSGPSVRRVGLEGSESDIANSFEWIGKDVIVVLMLLRGVNEEIPDG